MKDSALHNLRVRAQDVATNLMVKLLKEFYV